MKAIVTFSLTALCILAPACLAQKWEVGGVAGGGFYNNITVSNAMGSATTGFRSGPAFGAVLSQNLYRRVSGEMRYTCHLSDLKLSGFGDQVRFKGLTHTMHYDILIHTGQARSRARPFLAAGGGMRIFRGTGQESAYQPLSDFALLTKTQQWKPVISVGGGAKFVLAPRILLRVEFRDYITPFPTKVIAPAPGAKLGGWLHDFVPLVGITFVL